MYAEQIDLWNGKTVGTTFMMPQDRIDTYAAMTTVDSGNIFCQFDGWVKMRDLLRGTVVI